MLRGRAKEGDTYEEQWRDGLGSTKPGTRQGESEGGGKQTRVDYKGRTEVSRQANVGEIEVVNEILFRLTRTDRG